MRHVLFAPALAAFFATSVSAETCPAVPDYSTELNALIEATKSAPNEYEAQQLSLNMWKFWADAPDDRSQELLDEGMSRRASFDYSGALDALNALVEYCPEYAEGYNQRAFVNFLREDYEAALPDLDRTLELSPRHIAALTGQALTLAALDRNGEAALVLRRALDMNPWLSERHLLPALEATEQEL
jgi:tetratricopeptide (TPR) repeat protein